MKNKSKVLSKFHLWVVLRWGLVHIQMILMRLWKLTHVVQVEETCSVKADIFAWLTQQSKKIDAITPVFVADPPEVFSTVFPNTRLTISKAEVYRYKLAMGVYNLEPLETCQELKAQQPKTWSRNPCIIRQNDILRGMFHAGGASFALRASTRKALAFRPSSVSPIISTVSRILWHITHEGICDTVIVYHVIATVLDTSADATQASRCFSTTPVQRGKDKSVCTIFACLMRTKNNLRLGVAFLFYFNQQAWCLPTMFGSRYLMCSMRGDALFAWPQIPEWMKYNMKHKFWTRGPGEPLF